MAMQIILVMEASERSRSDYIYISSILDLWYDFRLRSDIKITRIFMDGKGNFNKKKIVNKIDRAIKEYKNGDSHVVYCFDTDKYDSNPDDLKVLQEEQKYCDENGYDFVWFCHDIEEVFLGASVSKSEKTDKAKEYIVNNGTDKLDKDDFKAETISKKRSNLIRVLEKYLFRNM